MRYLAISLVLIFSLGCSGSPVEDFNPGDDVSDDITTTGTVNIYFANYQPEDIDTIDVTISANDMNTITETLAVTAGDVSAIFYNIPAGSDRLFEVTAYEQATPIFEGAATIDVLADQTTTVSIVLYEIGAMPESVGDAEIEATFNYQPRIDYATATTNSPQVSETVNLSVIASDPDDDPLSYAWSTDGGTFSTTNQATTVWTAPGTTGTYHITITVADGNDGEASLQVEMTVE
ncbi:PKD domain-containing protein [bacterium]|nr:PKD domain-containing protein [bacterium]MBU1917092.1 PKD domain-containing protein [bacterium]